MSILLFVTATWLIASISIIGIGHTILHLARIPAVTLERNLLSFWIGFAAVIGVLQIWHLWLPIDWRATAVLAGIGVVGWYLQARNAWQIIQRWSWMKSLFTLIAALTTLWLAERALAPLNHYDSGLYHLTAVRWIVTYPIVPGLGNLHSRLAFNSSYFLYVAALDIGYWYNQVYRIANGLLILVFLIQILSYGFRLIFLSERSTTNLFGLFLVPPVLLSAKTSTTNIAPDLPVIILSGIIALLYLRSLTAERLTDADKRVDLLCLCSAVSVAITIKLNLAVLTGLSLLIAIAIIYIRGQRQISVNALLAALVAGALLLIPWMGRGIMLSGYPAYPSTIGAVAVEWQLAPDQADSMRAIILSWGRKPGRSVSEVAHVNSSWDWFMPWLEKNIHSLESVQIPAALILFGLILIVIRGVRRRGAPLPGMQIVLFLLPQLASSVFWFMTAPDLRFLGITQWVVGAGLVAFGFPKRDSSFTGAQPARLFFGSYYTVLAITASYVLFYLAGTVVVDPRSARQQKIPQAELTQYITNSGLLVYQTSKGDQCWDAPLPCTPYPNPSLSLRRPDDLGSGFIIGQ